MTASTANPSPEPIVNEDVWSRLIRRDPAEAGEGEEPPPEGFVPMGFGGPYFGQLGPVYIRRAPGVVLVMALRVAARHTNIIGTAHGGMLITLADSAIGTGIALARNSAEPPQAMVTVNLSSDFLGAALPGDWLEAHVRVRKRGSRLAFAECDLQVGDRPVLRCSGVFASSRRPLPAPGSPNDG